MTFDFRKNHFELFGLAPHFAVDATALDRAYRAIQSQVHPDRFVNAGDAERRASMQQATQVNEAYRTLKDPLARGRYLLELRGVDIASETNTAMPAEFLMQQMEWREALEEAAGQSESLDAIAARLTLELKQRYDELGRLLDGDAHVPAAESVRKLMFLERLREEISDARERLEV